MSYYLKSSNSTKEDFLGWKCYYGRTHYLTEDQQGEGDFKKPEWTGNIGYDWYKSPPSEIWTEDPTHGFLASYKDGCDNIGDMIEEEDGGGVVLKTMLIAGTDKQNDTQKMATLRLEDNNVYNKGGVFVMDVKQIPYACMVWPAFWLMGNKPGDWSTNVTKLKSTWPDYGEIDIIEQINGETENHTTLHTKDGCVTKGFINGKPLTYNDDGMAGGGGGDGAGGDMFNDCNRGSNEVTKKGGEIGCGMNMGSNSGGKEGGIYACEWVPNKEIKYWYWKQGDPQIPSDITKESKQVDTSKWRATKYTKHDLSNCAKDYFQDLHMIINTTVCGDWAGNTPPDGPGGECTWEGNRDGCEKKMKQFIANLKCKDKNLTEGCKKPDLEELEPFQWKINYVNTYTTDGAPDEESDNYLYWILGAIGVVFLVLILFIVVKNKKSKKTPEIK